jgi:hypothetical protein
MLFHTLIGLTKIEKLKVYKRIVLLVEHSEPLYYRFFLHLGIHQAPLGAKILFAYFKAA